MPAITTVQFRRGTAAQWSTANPVLAVGELGLETDTGKTKLGNGTNTWNTLAYQPNNTDIAATYVANSTKGSANGVASLDATGKVPAGQLPDIANAATTAQAYTLALINGG